MSKFKSECREVGERVIFSSGDPESETGGETTSQIPVAPRAWLAGGYRSLNPLVLNLLRATGAEFETEGCTLWLFPCGPPEMSSKPPGPLKLLWQR